MLRAVLLCALVLPLAALAGCAAPGAQTTPAADVATALSQPIFEKVLAEATPIASFDGTALDAWVFRPDTDEKVPVIINFSPYWHNLAPPTETGGDAFSLYLIDYFVPRGYAVALVSARGTGLSDGCFTIGGPLELQDEDAVATFFGEAEWSNGNLSATGKSYDGTMAQGLLTMGNPYVKTIAPVAPISELYKYNYYGGVPYGRPQTFNTDYVIATSLSQGFNVYDATPPEPTDPTYQKIATRICDESVAVQTENYGTAITGDYTPYWQARNYTALLPKAVDASVLYIHGLGDWNVKPDNIVPWVDELRARNVTVKMMLGQWAHDYPHRDDFNLTMLRWHDHYLKGTDTGILDEPLVQIQDPDGVWRFEDAFPPTRTTPLVLFPSADGSLGAQAGSGEAMYLDAPEGGPLARLVYETKAEKGFRIVGVPTFLGVVSATGPRATLSVALSIDGEIVDEGFLDLAHIAGLERTQPMTPGTQYAVTVPMYPQDLIVPAGATLRLTVAHNTYGMGGAAPSPTGALVTLHYGEGTALTLPTVALDDVRIEERQPEDIGCWAC